MLPLWTPAKRKIKLKYFKNLCKDSILGVFEVATLESQARNSLAQSW